MAPDEVKMLLAVIAQHDQRTWATDGEFETDAKLWHAHLAAVDYGLAEAAVFAFYHHEQRRRMTPGDVLDGVTEIRRDRLLRTPVPDPPPEVAADPHAVRAVMAAATEAITLGRDPDEAMAVAAIEYHARRELPGGGS